MISDNRKQIAIGATLALLTVATHGHHYASALNLPPATWAVFFLAGFYFRSARMFAALLVEVVILDYLATNIGGVSHYCISPAYGFLLPAYGSLWLAGRAMASRVSFSLTVLFAGRCVVAGVALQRRLVQLQFAGAGGDHPEGSVGERDGRRDVGSHGTRPPDALHAGHWQIGDGGQICWSAAAASASCEQKGSEQACPGDEFERGFFHGRSRDVLGILGLRNGNHRWEYRRRVPAGSAARCLRRR